MCHDEIVRFEATKGTHIYNAVKDIIRFLTIKEADDEYDLIFNDVNIKISRFANARAVAQQYFNKNEFGL